MKKEHLNCQHALIHADIVALVQRQILSTKEIAKLAKLYKNFAIPTRANILLALSIHELCVCDLASLLKMSKSAVSHQLKILRNSNLVKYRKEGKVVYYSLADHHVTLILFQGIEHINE